LDVKSKTRIIIFDLETNGLYAGCSVLSCSAIKYEFDPNTYEMTEIDRFNRYYYPVEEYDPQAIAVNRLTREVITEKRGDCTYPDHFCTDSTFETFCSDAERFVAHNISFEMQFVPFIGMNYDARIVERAYNTCKIKCRLISKEENELRKEEYKTSLIKEFKKPYTPKKPIILMIVAKKKKAAKVGDKLIIEFVDLDSFGFYPKFYWPWHIKFLNQACVTIGIFADDRSIMQRILKAHFNSYLFDIEVLEIAHERSSAWKGYPTKLVIKPFKIQ
jgi:hypothetical protein